MTSFSAQKKTIATILPHSGQFSFALICSLVFDDLVIVVSSNPRRVSEKLKQFEGFRQ